MNRFLARLLADLNVLLAIVIIVGATGKGFYMSKFAGDNLTFGAGIGFICGLIIAALVCGILALAVLIERHLRVIADDIRSKQSS